MNRTSKVRTHLFIALTFIIIFVRCSSTSTITVKYSPPIITDMQHPLLAGAAKVDITPPPGKPLAGYSSNANYANGFRTRLYARIIYLKAPSSPAIALVVCDLLSGSSLVQQKVAELISTQTDVPYSGIMIAGTHTHSGPGNFFESNFYNRFASNKSGFDQQYFTFLCQRIAQGIIDAYTQRKPAALAYGTKTLYGFTRNRSFVAYTANNTNKAGNPLKAVNPTMHMIRIDTIHQKSTTLLAAFTVFSFHGTTIPATNTLYSGDVFAYIERELEYEVQKKFNNHVFVHAVANGTHADNAPNITKDQQGFIESKRLGIAIAKNAIELYYTLSAQPNTKVDITSIINVIDVYAKPEIAGISLCIPPKVGNTLLAGASDGGPTPVLSSTPFIKEGSRRRILTCGCHKNKRIAGWPLQSLILPHDDFPHNLTFQVIRINNLLLLPIPFEITYESGNRIGQEALRTAIDNTIPVTTPIVISCANGYAGYCTTPQEYSQQRYEGGHTLYGPATQPFLAQHYAMLAKEIKNSTMQDSSWECTYTMKDPFPVNTLPVLQQTQRQIIQNPTYSINPGIGEPYVSFLWTDMPAEYMEFHKSLVSIEYSADGSQWKPFVQNGIPVDDTGYDIAVVKMQKTASNGMPLYEARWYNPPLIEKLLFRFVIAKRGTAKELYSPPFYW